MRDTIRPRVPRPRRRSAAARVAARLSPGTRPPPDAAPPKAAEQSQPTDYIAGDRIGGRVTKGGSGPCYGLVTDDGKQYALHSTAGLRRSRRAATCGSQSRPAARSRSTAAPVHHRRRCSRPIKLERSNQLNSWLQGGPSASRSGARPGRASPRNTVSERSR